MSTQRILIVYGSRYGQTAKIARRIAELLASDGLAPTILKGDELPARLDLAGFQGVIVGASLISGGHQSYIARFIKRNRDRLNRLPSAFFSVSGSAGSKEVKERETAQRIMNEFLASCDWRPWSRKTFGGAMAFTKYNPILRWMMRRISRNAGGPTDTSRDYELTDWSSVEHFALAFASHMHDVPTLVTADH
jgi:menaquinone-dependent protoporphyrinogen oxidase